MSGYSAEASALSVALDVRMAEVRAMQDGGVITCQQAADMRIEALERHLYAMRQLRADYFSESDQ